MPLAFSSPILPRPTLWGEDSYTFLVIRSVSRSCLVYSRDSEIQLRDWLSLFLTLPSGIQASFAMRAAPPNLSCLTEALHLPQLGSHRREAVPCKCRGSQLEAHKWIFTTKASQPIRIQANFGSWANILKESCDPDRCKASRFQTELGRGASFLNFVYLHIHFQLSHHSPTQSSKQKANRNGKERKERKEEVLRENNTVPGDWPL